MPRGVVRPRGEYQGEPVAQVAAARAKTQARRSAKHNDAFAGFARRRALDNDPRNVSIRRRN
jgi:hypothetical protein